MKRLILFLATLAVSFVWGYDLDEKGFVRDWLVSGPWPSYVKDDVDQGLDTDHLSPEDEAQPYAGLKAEATFIADWGKLVAGIGSVNEWGYRTNVTVETSWQERHETAEDGILRFNGVFGPIDDHFIAYAVCYVDCPEEKQARLAIGSDDDHKVYLNLGEVGKATSSQDVLPATFKYDVFLPKGRSRLLFKLQDRTGGCGFCLQLLDRADKPLNGVTIVLDTHETKTVLDDILAERRSPERLRQRMEAAKARLEKCDKELAEVMSERTILSNDYAVASARLSAAYEKREAEFAREHELSARKGARSVSEDFERASRRSSLCLNGFWEASVDGKDWTRSYLPNHQLNSYFLSWRFPVTGEGKVQPAFDGLFDPAIIGAEEPHFRTTFTWDGESDVELRCDAIIGVKPLVCVNDVVCGSWNGDRGVVRISLDKGLKKGLNKIEIISRRGKGGLAYGIRGDIYLETIPKIRVRDVWIKTSYRKSALGAKTEIENETESDRVVSVENYVIKGGKVRFRLPGSSVLVPAGGVAEVRQQGRWADPELWGIGGKYGEPNLYTLVTDIRQERTLIDRHEETFGFREFWIDHTDFYLNGRRILLRGDVGHLTINDKRRRDVVWPLYRKDGINIIRVHDSDQWSMTAVRDADRMGMAIYAQMYPIISEPGAENKMDDFAPFEGWTKTATHKRNLAAYTRWWRDLRNHPSVLIWSTDNEIFTQAWDVESRVAFNVRNDKVAELYEKHMQSLDPSLVITRDGDVGTWNRHARWFEKEPCMTANYHYPDYNNEAWAEAWQATYEFRPIIFGEALYCSYLQGRWVGELPKLVDNKAALLKRCISLYEELQIPCVVYMGLGLDGFTRLDETGNGNAWGIKASEIEAYNKEKTPIPNRREDQYPRLKIDWPAYSGEGERSVADSVSCANWGTSSVNVYEAGVVSHKRNAVNEAYRSCLAPQPPVDSGRDAEVIVRTTGFADVWTTTASGNRVGVRADEKGRAWFRSLEPGSRLFETEGRQIPADLKPRGEFATTSGFGGIQEIQ